MTARNGAARPDGSGRSDPARGSSRAGGGSGPRGSSVGRWASPGVVFLIVALVGSAAFVLYAITVRDASQIPLLAAGCAVLGIVFVALAAYALRATWQAGIDGRSGVAIGLAIGGGIAAIIAAGCLAGAIILYLLSAPTP